MKQKIRIIILFGSPFLYGSEKANIDVFSALSEYDDIEILFLIDGKRGARTIVPYLKDKSITYKSVPYHFMLRKNMNLIEWIVKIMEIIGGSYQLLRIYYKFKPTHIYTSKPEYFLNFFPLLFFIQKPIIYRIGDSPVLHNILYRKLWGYIVKKVSKIICVSKFIEHQVHVSGADKSKTEVIYSRPHDRKKTDNLPTQHEKKQTDVFTVLYVGQIAKHKGVDLLIEAAISLCKKYEDINFLIAGKIDKKDLFSQEQVALITKEKLTEKIQFLGYVSNVDELYMRSSLHVCPSVYDEPLANVLIDAKKHVIPSIIFNVGGLPEIIDDKNDGYICKEKTAVELEKAIEYFHVNQNECSVMGENASISLKKLQIDKFSERWLNVFESTI
jgi:glycosyltransferase involved in cell wall biosynthesis